MGTCGRFIESLVLFNGHLVHLSTEHSDLETEALLFIFFWKRKTEALRSSPWWISSFLLRSILRPPPSLFIMGMSVIGLTSWAIIGISEGRGNQLHGRKQIKLTGRTGVLNLASGCPISVCWMQIWPFISSRGSLRYSFIWTLVYCRFDSQRRGLLNCNIISVLFSWCETDPEQILMSSNKFCFLFDRSA